MNILESQHLPDLPIAQRRFILPHLSRNLRIRTLVRQELLSCHPLDRNRIVGSIEDPLFLIAKSQICPKSLASI